MGIYTDDEIARILNENTRLNGINNSYKVRLATLEDDFNYIAKLYQVSLQKKQSSWNTDDSGGRGSPLVDDSRLVSLTSQLQQLKSHQTSIIRQLSTLDTLSQNLIPEDFLSMVEDLTKANLSLRSELDAIRGDKKRLQVHNVELKHQIRQLEAQKQGVSQTNSPMEGEKLNGGARGDESDGKKPSVDSGENPEVGRKSHEALIKDIGASVIIHQPPSIVDQPPLVDGPLVNDRPPSSDAYAPPSQLEASASGIHHPAGVAVGEPSSAQAGSVSSSTVDHPSSVLDQSPSIQEQPLSTRKLSSSVIDHPSFTIGQSSSLLSHSSIQPHLAALQLTQQHLQDSLNQIFQRQSLTFSDLSLLTASSSTLNETSVNLRSDLHLLSQFHLNLKRHIHAVLQLMEEGMQKGVLALAPVTPMDGTKNRRSVGPTSDCESPAVDSRGPATDEPAPLTNEVVEKEVGNDSSEIPFSIAHLQPLQLDAKTSNIFSYLSSLQEKTDDLHNSYQTICMSHSNNCQQIANINNIKNNLVLNNKDIATMINDLISKASDLSSSRRQLESLLDDEINTNHNQNSKILILLSYIADTAVYSTNYHLLSHGFLQWKLFSTVEKTSTVHSASLTALTSSFQSQIKQEEEEANHEILFLNNTFKDHISDLKGQYKLEIGKYQHEVSMLETALAKLAEDSSHERAALTAAHDAAMAILSTKLNSTIQENQINENNLKIYYSAELTGLKDDTVAAVLHNTQHYEALIEKRVFDYDSMVDSYNIKLSKLTHRTINCEIKSHLQVWMVASKYYCFNQWKGNTLRGRIRRKEEVMNETYSERLQLLLDTQTHDLKQNHQLLKINFFYYLKYFCYASKMLSFRAWYFYYRRNKLNLKTILNEQNYEWKINSLINNTNQNKYDFNVQMCFRQLLKVVNQVKSKYFHLWKDYRSHQHQRREATNAQRLYQADIDQVTTDNLCLHHIIQELKTIHHNNTIKWKVKLLKIVVTSYMHVTTYNAFKNWKLFLIHKKYEIKALLKTQEKDWVIADMSAKHRDLFVRCRSQRAYFTVHRWRNDTLLRGFHTWKQFYSVFKLKKHSQQLFLSLEKRYDDHTSQLKTYINGHLAKEYKQSQVVAKILQWQQCALQCFFDRWRESVIIVSYSYDLYQVKTNLESSLSQSYNQLSSYRRCYTVDHLRSAILSWSVHIKHRALSAWKSSQYRHKLSTFIADAAISSAFLVNQHQQFADTANSKHASLVNRHHHFITSVILDYIMHRKRHYLHHWICYTLLKRTNTIKTIEINQMNEIIEISTEQNFNAIELFKTRIFNIKSRIAMILYNKIQKNTLTMNYIQAFFKWRDEGRLRGLYNMAQQTEESIVQIQSANQDVVNRMKANTIERIKRMFKKYNGVTALRRGFTAWLTYKHQSIKEKLKETQIKDKKLSRKQKLKYIIHSLQTNRLFCFFSEWRREVHNLKISKLIKKSEDVQTQLQAEYENNLKAVKTNIVNCLSNKIIIRNKNQLKRQYFSVWKEISTEQRTSRDFIDAVDCLQQKFENSKLKFVDGLFSHIMKQWRQRRIYFIFSQWKYYSSEQRLEDLQRTAAEALATTHSTYQATIQSNNQRYHSTLFNFFTLCISSSTKYLSLLHKKHALESWRGTVVHTKHERCITSLTVTHQQYLHSVVAQHQIALSACHHAFEQFKSHISPLVSNMKLKRQRLHLLNSAFLHWQQYQLSNSNLKSIKQLTKDFFHQIEYRDTIYQHLQSSNSSLQLTCKQLILFQALKIMKQRYLMRGVRRWTDMVTYIKVFRGKQKLIQDYEQQLDKVVEVFQDYKRTVFQKNIAKIMTKEKHLSLAATFQCLLLAPLHSQQAKHIQKLHTDLLNTQEQYRNEVDQLICQHQRQQLSNIKSQVRLYLSFLVVKYRHSFTQYGFSTWKNASVRSKIHARDQLLQSNLQVYETKMVTIQKNSTCAQLRSYIHPLRLLYQSIGFHQWRMESQRSQLQTLSSQQLDAVRHRQALKDTSFRNSINELQSLYDSFIKKYYSQKLFVAIVTWRSQSMFSYFLSWVCYHNQKKVDRVLDVNDSVAEIMENAMISEIEQQKRVFAEQVKRERKFLNSPTSLTSSSIIHHQLSPSSPHMDEAHTLRKKIASLEYENAFLKDNKGNNNNEIVLIMKQINLLETEMHVLQNKYRAKQSELNDSHRVISNLKTQISQISKDLSHNIKELVTNEETYKRDLFLSIVKIEELKKQNEDLNRRLQQVMMSV